MIAMAKHILRIKKIYFEELSCGRKSLEVRVGYPDIRRIKEGDVIHFENYGSNLFDVVRVSVYNNFQQMLEYEGVRKVLPGMSFGEALKTYRKIYRKEREALGVYVFELKRH
jgi:ASC-1-like (ASCH) protein